MTSQWLGPFFGVLFFVLHSIFCATGQEQGAEPDPDTSFVIVGLRHALRNPEKFCCGYRSTLGPLQLTDLGKKQAWYTGEWLRKRYAGLLPSTYSPAFFNAHSSSADRCQMTLQAVTAGLFSLPPNQNSIPNSNWQPVPYSIDDPLLRMYKIECPASDSAWKPVIEDTLPNLDRILTDQKGLIDFTLRNSNFSGGSRLSLMADVADNLINLRVKKQELPSWISGRGGNSTSNIEEDVMKFAEIHQKACAEYKPCRDMMAGLWLSQILEQIEDKMNGNANKLRMSVYASHTEIVLSALYGMGVSMEDVGEVGMGGGFLLEFKIQPSPLLRLLLLTPNYNKPEQGPKVTVITPAVRKSWRSAEKFLAALRANAFVEWESRCNGAPPQSISLRLILLFAFLWSAA